MATQTGIIVESPGKAFTIVNDIHRPSPGPKQVLVKPLAVGLNPVDPMQQQTGLLVKEWPAILGSDVAGIVIDVGPECTKFKKGDYIFGCAPLGQNKFTPFQETFLAQEDVFLKKGPNLSIEEAAATSVGLMTSSLCLLGGTKLELPEEGVKAPEKDEWVVVLGGSGTVGQFAVQVAHVCGYKVIASCSPSKKSIPIQNGAKATFDNRAPVDEQVAEIKKITGGNFARVFDSTARGYSVMLKALETSTATTKYLASVDSWSPFRTPSTINEYRVDLGLLCRPEVPLGREVTRNIASWITTFEKHLAAGTIKPIGFRVIDGVGWKQVIQGLQDLTAGKATKKIIVRTQEE